MGRYQVILAVATWVGLLLCAGCEEQAAPTSASALERRMGSARQLYDEGQLEMALRVTQDVVKARPEVYEAHALMARIYFDLDRPSHAVPAARDALALRPELAEAHLELATYLLAANQTAEAAAALDEAEKMLLDRVRRSNLNTDARLYLAMVAHLRGNTDSALSQVNLVLAERPDSAKAKAMKEQFEVTE